MSSHLVVTIARQYGSGGREIGAKVAELLGVKTYDRELITIAAQKSGMSAETIGSFDERATNSLLFTLAMGSSIYTTNAAASFNVPANDKLFAVQSEIIRDLAEKEDCIVVGRCGDYVLRDHEKLLSVFIYADPEVRIKRIMERHGLDYGAAKDLVNKTDKRRINYYNFYTGRKWGKVDHYNLAIDSGFLGIDGTAELIAGMAGKIR